MPKKRPVLPQWPKESGSEWSQDATAVLQPALLRCSVSLLLVQRSALLSCVVTLLAVEDIASADAESEVKQTRQAQDPATVMVLRAETLTVGPLEVCQALKKVLSELPFSYTQV